MKKVENTMKTLALLSEDNSHRYLLEKTWGTGKKAMIIMLYPCAGEITQQDLTTTLCLNNASKLDFGSISIVNLYSKINADLSHDISEINTPDNDTQIVKSANESDCIVIAWGHGNKSKAVVSRQKAVLKLLLPFTDKLMTIENEAGTKNIHPLTPSVRSHWNLSKYDMPVLTDEPSKDEAKSGKKNKKRQKQAETQNEDERQDTGADGANNEETE